MTPLCPVTVLRCARIYARRGVPQHLAHLREDIAADATLRVLEKTSRGVPISKHMWRWAVTDSVRAACGDRRTVTGRARSGARRSDPEALTVESSAADVTWCVTRLASVWPRLTPVQQDSVTHWLAGEVTPGVHPSAACRARAAAFELIRNGNTCEKAREGRRKQAA